VSDTNPSPKRFEQRINDLEEAVRIVVGLNDDDDLEIGKLQESVKSTRAKAKQFETKLAVLETRMSALEEKAKTALPILIEEKVNTARTGAETTAQKLVEALSEDGGPLFNLNKEVENLKPPEPAADTATRLVEEYRKLPLDKPDELKKRFSKERRDVLVEIASRLDPEDDHDSQLLSNMFALVDDKVLMAELVSFAGKKSGPPSA
jgi:hypothetical protein